MIRTCYARIVDSAEAVRGVMETIVDGKNGKKDSRRRIVRGLVEALQRAI